MNKQPLHQHPTLSALSTQLAWSLTAVGLFCSLVLAAGVQPPGSRAELQSERLTSRPRLAAPAMPTLMLGDIIRTEAGQRRRLGLPDGSTLYVNENTVAKLEQQARLNLSAGEIYVETSVSAGTAPLVIKTAQRAVRAGQSNLAVRAVKTGTAVLVTRGQASVSGLDEPLRAGQQLPAGSAKPVPAPRTSVLLDWTRELRLAAESPLVPGSSYQGGALVAVNPDGQEMKLTLRKYHIDIHIEDGFARTTIDQTYFNDSLDQMEGTFYFPLPADASLSQLAMYVDGNLMEGGMVERDLARNIYETIRYRQRDPALLEWLDGSTFKMRVFPIEPRQEKRLLLSYTQKLPTLYGQTQYRFPAGHSLPAVREWSLHAVVKDGAKLAWASPSHALKGVQEGTDLVLSGSAGNARFDRDVVLTLGEPVMAGKAGENVRLSLAAQDGFRYLMVRCRPDLLRPAQGGDQLARGREPKSWVFLFESSGDRDPLLARVQIDVIRGLLAQAEPDDTFTVLTAGTRVRALDKELRPVTTENVQQALAFLEGSHLIGALDLRQALAEAEPILKKAGNSYLVHVGSGIAAMGERREDVLAKGIPEGTRYVGVGVGRRWARSFMKMAAEHSGGYFTQINPDELIGWRVFELASTVQTLAANPSGGVEVSLPAARGSGQQPTFLYYSRSLAPGEELCAIARLDGKGELPGEVTVRFGDKEQVAVPLRDAAGKADYLPRMWAKSEIDRLLAEDAVKNKDSIIALSRAMYVMTPYTSLLVLESEEMYAQYKVERGRKDHWAAYPCPQKIRVVYEPVPDQPNLRKVAWTAKEVPQTILVRASHQLLPPLGGLRPALTQVPADAVRFPSQSGFRPEESSPTTPGLFGIDLFGRQAAARMPLSPWRQGIVTGLPGTLALPLAGSNPLTVPDRATASKPDTDVNYDLDRKAAVPVSGVVNPNEPVDIEWASKLAPPISLPVPPGLGGSRGGASPATFEGNSDPVGQAAGFSLRGMPPIGTFYGRSGATKAVALREGGGTRESEATVAAGLNWLARVQSADGRWRLDGDYPDKGSANDIAGTALGLLPFLGAGKTHKASKDNPYDRMIERGLFFLVRKQDRKTGNFGGGTYGHCLATMAMCEAYGLTGGPMLRRPAQMAVNYLVYAQHDGGGWRYRPNQAGDLSVTGWAVLALKSARMAALDVPTITFRKAVGFVGSCAAANEGYGYQGSNSTPAMSAVGLLCRQYLQAWGPENARLLRGIKNNLEPVPPGAVKNMYYYYHATQVMYHVGGGAWAKWNEKMRDHLVETRNQSDHPKLRGSWSPAGDVYGEVGGRLLQTSLCLLTLEVYYRYLPLRYREAEEASPDPPRETSPEQPEANSPLLYRRPSYRDPDRVFYDLVAYAPGMNTTEADIAAVLEAEGRPGPNSRPGRIDPAARKLLDKARAAGWQVFTLPGESARPASVVQFDGHGRYTCERVVPPGIRERVVCDSQTLLDLYPQLGLGARRTVSRFHRLDFSALVPWFVPPAEDLARGADLELAGERTVALIPHRASTAHGPGNELAASVRVHLVFAGDGRLTERQLVRMPGGKVLYRQTCTADGEVKLWDGAGKELATRRGKLSRADAPDLAPDTGNLVVLPLPYRSPEYVRRVLASKGWRDRDLPRVDALRRLAAYFATGDRTQVLAVFHEAFNSKGLQPLGFYVLLAACGVDVNAPGADVLAEHLDEPLADYLSRHNRRVLRNSAGLRSTPEGQEAAGFLRHLAAAHTLYQFWRGDQVSGANAARLRAERQRALDYVRQNKDSALGWEMLCLLQGCAGDDKQFHGELAGYWSLFEGQAGLTYAARYEHARSLWRSGRRPEARKGFQELHADALRQGFLPPVDADFRHALRGNAGEPGSWGELLRAAATSLLRQNRRSAALALAWQCWELDDQPLANQLVALTLKGVMEEKERVPLTLAAIRFFQESGQLPLADELLQGLLADAKQAQRPELWRLAATLAEQRNLMDRSVEYLERALDAEHRKPLAVIDLQAVRQEYGKVLEHYQSVADGLARLKIQPPKGFRARVVRTADRWRALDPDPAQACQSAAQILGTLGEPELSWDYLTTPVGLRPNEAAPWVELAQTLRHNGEGVLADRAYKAAVEAEPTNADLLWERAENLRQAGKAVEARLLFRQIAEGRWQPRFQPTQARARSLLGQP